MPAAIPIILGAAAYTGVSAAIGGALFTAIAGSTIGTIAATAIGTGVLSAGISVAQGADLGDAIKNGVLSGATSFVGGTIGSYISSGSSAAASAISQDAAFIAADAAQMAQQGLSQNQIAYNLAASGVNAGTAQAASVAAILNGGSSAAEIIDSVLWSMPTGTAATANSLFVDATTQAQYANLGIEPPVAGAQPTYNYGADKWTWEAPDGTLYNQAGQVLNDTTLTAISPPGFTADDLIGLKAGQTYGGDPTTGYKTIIDSATGTSYNAYTGEVVQYGTGSAEYAAQNPDLFQNVVPTTESAAEAALRARGITADLVTQPPGTIITQNATGGYDYYNPATQELIDAQTGDIVQEAFKPYVPPTAVAPAPAPVVDPASVPAWMPEGTVAVETPNGTGFRMPGDNVVYDRTGHIIDVQQAIAPGPPAGTIPVQAADGTVLYTDGQTYYNADGTVNAGVSNPTPGGGTDTAALSPGNQQTITDTTRDYTNGRLTWDEASARINQAVRNDIESGYLTSNGDGTYTAPDGTTYFMNNETGMYDARVGVPGGTGTGPDTAPVGPVDQPIAPPAPPAPEPPAFEPPDFPTPGPSLPEPPVEVGPPAVEPGPVVPEPPAFEPPEFPTPGPNLPAPPVDVAPPVEVGPPVLEPGPPVLEPGPPVTGPPVLEPGPVAPEPPSFDPSLPGPPGPSLPGPGLPAPPVDVAPPVVEPGPVAPELPPAPGPELPPAPGPELPPAPGPELPPAPGPELPPAPGPELPPVAEPVVPEPVVPEPTPPADGGGNYGDEGGAIGGIIGAPAPPAPPATRPGYGPITPMDWGAGIPLDMSGLNPGYITNVPRQYAPSGVRSQYYYGPKPYQAGTTFDPALYQSAPAAPVAPWGLQQMYNPQTQTIENLLRGVGVAAGQAPYNMPRAPKI